MWQGTGISTTALAGVGLTWLVQSTILLAGGLAAGGVVKKVGAAVQSGVYRTTIAAVLICPFASAILAAAGYNGLTVRLPLSVIGEAPAADRQTVFPLSSTSATAPHGREALAEVVEQVDVSARMAAETPSEPDVPSQSPSPPPAPTSLSVNEAVAAIGLSVWLFGAVLLATRLLVSHRRMTRLRASAVPAEPGAEALCGELAARMGVAAPAVLRSPFLFSPCLDGLRKPVILLPEDIDENLRDTFIHELAHLARRDGLWNLVRRSSIAVFWVQPLIWVLSRRMEVAAEEVCDDFVVQFGADRTRYAGHLLELAERTLPPMAPAGVGMVSLRSMLARRVVRLLDTSRSLSTRAGTRAVVAMVVIGLAGTLLAGMLGVGSGMGKALAQVAETNPAPKGEAIRAQVVGPDGKPVPGAKVVARRRRARSRPGEFENMFSPPGMGQYEYVTKTTDAEGRFEVTFDPSQPNETATAGAIGCDIIATAPGFGLGYYLKDKPIRLSAGDQPVDGRLVDLEGRPLARVHLRFVQIWIPDPEARRAAEAQTGPYEFPTAKSVGLEGDPFLPGGMVTDADGRFRIEGLGRDVMALLEVSGPKVAYKRFRIISRANSPIAAEPRESGSRGVGVRTIYGAHCTVPVEPTRPIEGVVRDIETNEPISGAVVTANRLSAPNGSVIHGLIRTETDSHGRYRLLGLPKAGADSHSVAVYPPTDRPYFVTDDIVVPGAPGFDPVKLDIALRRATWATGRVTDVSTGKPVENALVDYFPMVSNERAKDYPNFNPAITGSIAIKKHYRTDKKGRFRIAALHGRGVITVRVEFGPYRTGFGAEAIKGRSSPGQLQTYDHIYISMYNGLKEVDIPEGSASFSCDVPLDPGGSLMVRLVDPSGMPVTTASVTGRFPDSIDLNRDMRGESVAKVVGLEPGKSRTLMAREQARKLGALLIVPPEGSKDGDEITLKLRPNASVTGRVVDEAGKPAEGYIQVGHVPTVKQFHPEIPIGLVKVDADGRFRCDDLPAGGSYRIWLINRQGSMAMVRTKSDAFQPFELVEKLNVEPGQVVELGTYNVVTGKRIAAPAAKAEPAGVPITGRIVDLEGRPVAGVLVKVGAIHGPKAGDLTAWIEGIKIGEPPWIAYRQLGVGEQIPDSLRRDATTDGDGRFRLEGLGPERVVELTIKGESIAYTLIDVVTRKTDPIAARGFANHYGPGSRTVYGAEFTYAAAPTRPVEGVIKDTKTGNALDGAEVRSYRFAGSTFVGIMSLKTKTDTQGRFRMTGLPKGKDNTLIVVPNDEQPYFMQEVKLPEPPGTAPVSVVVAMHRGLWVEGRLTEEATGKPLPDAWLHYMPFLENTFAQAVPVYGKNGNTQGVGFQDRYKTRADGSFRLVGLPGRGLVGAVVYGKAFVGGAGSESIKGMDKRGVFRTYNNPIPPGKLWPTVMTEINPPAEQRAVHVELRAVTGASIHIRVVDESEKPITGLKTQGRTGRSSFDREDLAGSEGEVTNLRPDEERLVIVRQPSRRLGKVVTVRKGDDAKGPVVVTLRSLAAMTGRVVDGNGNPVPGATVRPDVLPGGNFSLHLNQVATDDLGRFLIPEVPTGADYALVVESRRVIKNSRFAFLKRASVKPGETTDVGEIRFKGESVNGPEKHSAVEGPQPVAKEMPINGRIVDLEGRPVAGAVVKAGAIHSPKTGDLTAWIEGVKKGEPPWIAYRQLAVYQKIPESVRREVTTGGDGRFRFDGLGRERIVELTINGDTVAFTSIDVVTRKTSNC